MSNRITRLLGSAFGWLCLLYPREFRRLFREDMKATFREESRRVYERGGVSRLLLFCAGSFVAVAAAAVAERLRARVPKWPRGSRAASRSNAKSRTGWAAALARDARYAMRGMLRSPAFTVTALVTVMIGVAATTTIFSVVNGVLLKPLPYPEPDRLVQIFQQNSPTNRWNLSVADYQAIAEQGRGFESVTALARGEATLTGRGDAEAIPVMYATADLFRTLAVEPIEGRGFHPREDRPGGEPVAVISHAFSERVFGVNAHAVGEVIELDGRAYTVIGVMPRGVRALGDPRPVEVWPILQLDPPTRRGPFFLRGIARLEAEASLEDAGRELAGISERIYPIWADGFTDATARLTPVPLHEVIVGNIGNGLLMLLGAVALLLLISVANVASLLLARATARAREMALRTSLGATKVRLASQLLVESLILALTGGALGVLASELGVRALVALGPALPRLDQVTIDLRVAGFALSVALASGVAFGLAPLAHALSPGLATGLRSGERGSTVGRTWGRLRSGIVAAEFALTLPLLVAAALLLSSFVNLARVDVGFDPDDLITARIPPLSSTEYPDAASRQLFWSEALRLIEELPEVEAAGVGAGVPPNNPGTINNFDLLDKPVPPGASQPISTWTVVTPGYFEALGMPLIRGRLIDHTDTHESALVVVVSRSWAEKYYPGEEVLGKQLYAGGYTAEAVTVVGVVGDVKFRGLAGEAAAVYEPYTQNSWRFINLVVRTRARSADIATRIMSQVRSLDPDIALTNFQTMDDRLSTSVAQPKYWLTLVGLFAGVGVLLAAVGIYGVLSYYVNRQTREIGVRMALGANAAAVRRMILRRGIGNALLGIVLGLAGSLVATRWLESLLFGVSAGDPTVALAASLALLIVALAACYLPARRATAVDPVRALSVE